MSTLSSNPDEKARTVLTPSRQAIKRAARTSAVLIDYPSFVDNDFAFWRIITTGAKLHLHAHPSA